MADRARAARAIREFLEAIGADPSAPDLAGTPERVADAWLGELLEGERVDVARLLAGELIARAADAGAEIVAVRDVPVTTVCPHHLMPGTGVGVVAFEPRARVLGVGAVARAVQATARRLALQESTGQRVARAVFEAAQPAWAACRLVVSHTCMTARGERPHGATLETLAVVGEGDRAAIERAVGLGR